MKPVGEKNRLWYRRAFTAPAGLARRSARCCTSARSTGRPPSGSTANKSPQHRGGYDPFSCDVTDGSQAATGEQEIVVAVWDPTDKGTQPRGKQVQKPGGIFYTPTTGIWQTVWLEVVPETYIASLKITPDVDQGKVRIEAKLGGTADGDKVWARLFEGNAKWPSPKPKRPTRNWSSRSTSRGSGPRRPVPVLDQSRHRQSARLRRQARTRRGTAADQVESYCGLRKIALGKDSHGITRLMLNGKPLFQTGRWIRAFGPTDSTRPRPTKPCATTSK